MWFAVANRLMERSEMMCRWTSLGWRRRRRRRRLDPVTLGLMHIKHDFVWGYHYVISLILRCGAGHFGRGYQRNGNFGTMLYHSPMSRLRRILPVLTSYINYNEISYTPLGLKYPRTDDRLP
ncbi:hypothetical protein BYT27DRAFT_6953375 [Phlegmacium glaucopus]|nr:hypothetical protein BYT27DRAFT_6953375 [Phlegmacium glaucopus]